MRILSLVTAVAGLMLSMVATEGRLVHPSDLMMQALRSRTYTLDATLTPELIDGYQRGNGFPKARRTLAQKIAEAEEFLAEQIPKSGIVGTGVAIVYEDQVVLAKGYGLRTANDTTSKVTADAMFQIGSVSKTMVAVGIGMLVEDNKLKWRDPVKKHLPWLRLFDKYAEEHVTIGDLLAMNSGFDALPDLADFFGQFPTERAYVEALKDCEPTYSLREQPEYANVNFVILGQLIESVTGTPWHKFLHERLWSPLGMDHTFASPAEVPVALRQQSLNDGHFACGGEVLGPYDIVSAPEMQLAAGHAGNYDAAGSVVSSSADMAKFLRLILNKGTVGNVTLLHSPSTIIEMVSGKNVATGEIGTMMPQMGLHFDPEGGTIAAGYGIDIIGQAIWGHAYFDKSGDVVAHQTRTGFAPLQKLAMIIMGNSQAPDPHATFYLDHHRSYVLGIFLDVPKSILDFEFKKWRAADQLQSMVPGAPVCGARFWKNPPSKTLAKEDEDALVGTYVATTSTKFYPKAVISRAVNAADKGFTIQLAQYSSKLTYVGNLASEGSPLVLLATGGSMPLPLVATKNAKTGQFTLNIGVDYRKQQ